MQLFYLINFTWKSWIISQNDYKTNNMKLVSKIRFSVGDSLQSIIFCWNKKHHYIYKLLFCILTQLCLQGFEYNALVLLLQHPATWFLIVTNSAWLYSTLFRESLIKELKLVLTRTFIASRYPEKHWNTEKMPWFGTHIFCHFSVHKIKN